MEHISALMDGELDEHQMRRHLARLKQDPDLRDCWDMFHLIGDALRGEPGLSETFGGAMREKLASEPTVLAPRRTSMKRIAAYALTAAASLSAVAAVGWLAFFNNPLVPQSQVATSSPSPPAITNPSPQLTNLPSDGTMNEYLIAHQEYSPSTAIQGLAPYIRTVSSAQPNPER